MKYRTRPTVIEAWQWKGRPTEYPLWISECFTNKEIMFIRDEKLLVSNPSCGQEAEVGDWVVRKGVDMELCVYDNLAFNETFEPFIEEDGIEC